MSLLTQLVSRREFVSHLARIGVTVSAVLPWVKAAAAESPARPASVIKFPAQWSFLLPKGSIILVSDQQLDELTDPDKEIDLSLSSTPNKTTLRRICEQHKAAGTRTGQTHLNNF
jgi:hypothetical protein